VTLIYPIESNAAHPAPLSPAYKSSIKRAPQKPLIPMRHTLSELTGPVYGHERVRDGDNDLTTEHKGEPLGERIIVHGHVLDEDGRGVPNTLVELWQANARGRYVHVRDQHPAPLDPNFTGACRAQSDAADYYRFVTIKPGAYPWGNHHNAWRPADPKFPYVKWREGRPRARAAIFSTRASIRRRTTRTWSLRPCRNRAWCRSGRQARTGASLSNPICRQT
jgi:protocatechuate 3,4-dioxygenase beta subunit